MLCCAGSKAYERPVRFHLGNRGYILEEVLDQWYGPHDTSLRVGPKIYHRRTDARFEQAVGT